MTADASHAGWCCLVSRDKITMWVIDHRYPQAFKIARICCLRAAQTSATRPGGFSKARSALCSAATPPSAIDLVMAPGSRIDHNSRISLQEAGRPSWFRRLFTNERLVSRRGRPVMNADFVAKCASLDQSEFLCRGRCLAFPMFLAIRCASAQRCRTSPYDPPLLCDAPAGFHRARHRRPAWQTGRARPFHASRPAAPPP